MPFAQDTHDFESRYLDGLIGPLPEAHDLYVERSPLTHLDQLRTPILLLQGDDDKVVPPSQPQARRRLSVSPGVNECMQMRPSAHARRSARRK